jgi:predicted AAA+ superfamily ATPase
MERLFEKFQRKMASVPMSLTRTLLDEIKWDVRLVGIRGARGVGKTTLLLQWLKRHHAQDAGALYVSLDDIWFSEHRLVELADTFVKRGGRYLFLDEVHKYPDWSREIKNIYDDHRDLHVVFTGSSLLEILNARADLSRRAVAYDMQGLSFREYLNMTQSVNLPAVSLHDILSKHGELSDLVLSKVKPLQFFNTYLKQGYYPFFAEGVDVYESRVEEVVNFILEVELPLLRGVETSHVRKLKQLLLVIAESAPFTPNVSKLSERVGINRVTFLGYLHALQEAGLTRHLYREGAGMTRLQKPDKIFLENTNLAAVLTGGSVDTGSARESFFHNQLAYRHEVQAPASGDFIVDRRWTFEVGGKNKTGKQIRGVKDAFVVADGIEYGFGNQLPLWLFGFLY